MFYVCRHFFPQCWTLSKNLEITNSHLPLPTLLYSLAADSGGHMRWHPEGLQWVHLQL